MTRPLRGRTTLSGNAEGLSPSPGNRHQVPETTVYKNAAGNPAGGQNTLTLIGASSFHPGGVSVLMMDGSVKFVKNSINHAMWIAIATKDRGEIVSSNAF